jgi:solute carrier family 35 protein E3
MSSVVLLLLCPLMDNVSALAMYPFSAPLVSGLLLSSIVALATNWSLFALLGALSPLTYNILGHIKTISILLIAFTFFHEDPTGKKIFGIIVALTGMITYSFA